ncbi:MAG TPA: AMP-binding protein [Frankiaceae bacterium]|nr:AMP-binding protein [Frankiaceae bacterium]
MSDPVDPAAGGDQASNVADLVRSAARGRGEHAALVGAHRSTSWADLDGDVDRMATALRGMGLVMGDRIAVVLGNVVEFAVTYYGALRAGLVVVPVNPAYTAREMAHLLSDSGARLAVVAGPYLATLQEARQSAPALETVVAVGREAADGVLKFAEVLAEAAPGAAASAGAGEDLAVLLYTSGTTGTPKGAMLTHRALLADLRHVGSIAPPVVSSDDVVLLVLPLFHVFGLNSGLGMVAAAGATGVLVERFDPSQTLEVVMRRGVSVVLGAPPVFVAWSMLPQVSDAFAGLRLAVSGAAPLAPDVVRRLLDLTGRYVFEGYGLTEAAPTVTSTLMSEVPKPGSVGRPVPGVEVRLLDSSGAEVDADDPGEIAIRGANLFSGYWPDGHDGPDAEGWWRTADLAIERDGGDLQLVDRRPELILVSGFNVYPREVEDVLLTHPDIVEAAVFGIPHPYTGDAVKALIVLRPGAVLSVDDVIAHAGRSLARFKSPTAVEFVPALPHTSVGPMGKVAKARLREMGLHDVSGETPDEPVPAPGS